MDRKKELKQAYKEVKIESGIYVITNNQNGKKFIASTRNFKTLNGTKFTLETGTHTNRQLQEEWNQFGKDAFEIEKVEILKPSENQFIDEKKELEKLLSKWIEQMQPFGDKGYHT
ncbi:GIY-YIG nuclease family protein [Psychrobacillus glaciei]|uniref:GIY-YIG nuclease family protein n=1 Tax=Psychrobacillus glaciei TaxID=2283160 RepID=A0A5J6SMT6_9BACI|nr:GIY-YIG nuclease family protein [Psychrobacillus glaciei]QFF97517.1 GIY-YIG nuclease family protein [Psychrobacillus glaciei]